MKHRIRTRLDLEHFSLSGKSPISFYHVVKSIVVIIIAVITDFSSGGGLEGSELFPALSGVIVMETQSHRSPMRLTEPSSNPVLGLEQKKCAPKFAVLLLPKRNPMVLSSPKQGKSVMGSLL